ncbi:MAG: sugar phosphate isomerase/epimerase [Bacteroidota bacterium]
MKKDRRQFLHLAGAAAAGSLLLPSWACSAGSNENTAAKGLKNETMSSPSLKEFGIQLYTLRDDFPNDPKGVLKQLAQMGYKQIEGFEGPKGMFWEMGHLEFKQYLDDIGLKMVASHCNINNDLEAKAAQAAEIGMEYLICPWVGPQKSQEDWKKVVDRFNECGRICQKEGIRFAYHNHAYSFKAFSGMIPHDFIMDHTDPELVDHEMDIYWVVTGGADPIEYLTKYANRFRLCHIKDRMKEAPAEEAMASCDLGTGMIDYPKILKVAAAYGMKYFLLEQERYDNSTPLKSVAVGAEYLKQLVFT